MFMWGPGLAVSTICDVQSRVWIDVKQTPHNSTVLHCTGLFRVDPLLLGAGSPTVLRLRHERKQGQFILFNPMSQKGVDV